jgi:hypothetical protein
MHFLKEGVVLGLVLEILFGSTFDMQQNFFKIIMKSLTTNVMWLPFDGNLVTWLWHTISSFWMLWHNLLEYLKFAKIISILVFQSVETKKCFLIMKLLKSNLCNKLGPNFPIVVRMFWQHFFTLVQFLYKNAIEFWKNETNTLMMFSFIIYPFEFSHFVDLTI